jgi:hypothetical protein
MLVILALLSIGAASASTQHATGKLVPISSAGDTRPITALRDAVYKT